MDITIVTSAPTNEEALDLLKMMGMPFAEGNKPRKPKPPAPAPANLWPKQPG
jgi:hypothetical protein